MRPIRLSLQYFGSYTDKQTIDFDLLGTKGLYLITGDTGSGKTTIFDAILYALYGSMSGEYRSKDTTILRSTMAQETDKTEVELVFEFNGIHYTITRWMEYMQPKKRGAGFTEGKAGATMSWPDCLTPISGTKEVSAKILEILGISRDQFSQIAMIAQGDFMKLLMENTDKRIELFRKIFRTENFKALQERISKEFKDEYQRLSDEKVSVNSIIDMVEYDEDSTHSIQLAQTKDNKGLPPVSVMIDIIKSIQKEDAAKKEELSQQREAQEAIINTCRTNISIIDSHAESAKQLPIEQEKLKDLTNVQKPAKDQALNTAKAEEPRIKELTEQANKIEGTLKAYEDLTKWKRTLSSASTTLEDINKPEVGRKVKNERAFSTLENERKKLTDEQISLGNPDNEKTKIENDLNALKQYQHDLSNLSKKRGQLTTEQNNFKTLKEKATDAENEWSRMTNLFYSAQAGILAEILEEGKPCPVCGSTHHPVKAQKAKDVPSEEELKQQESKAKELRNKSNEQSNKCSGLIETIQNEEERFTKLGWSIDEAELETLPSRIATLEEQIKELSAKIMRIKAIPDLIAELDTKRENLLKEKDAITKEETNAKNDIKTANEQIADLQKRCTYVDENAARRAIADLRKQAEELQTTIDKAQGEFQKVLNEIENVKVTIKTHENNLKNVVTLNKDDESAKWQNAQKTLDDITPRINTIIGREGTNNKALKELQSAATRLERIEKRYQWLKTLNDTVLGQLSGKEKIMLETYILSTYFERIIHKANLRLLKMTNNQYELRRKRDAANNRQQTGLDLDVVDHHNGKIRTVKSLSGGESFMASLSLALGLSDEIQSSCGGIHLNTMFVDEGFGSLDEESRVLARNTLQKLSQEGNRLIGVISHVPELKAIERQIQVHKDHNGVSTAEVVLL